MTSIITPRFVAISTGPSTHLDHLGILAALLSIPLIVTEESHLELCQRYYSKTEAFYLSLADLSTEYLSTHFDIILTCGKFWALELSPVFELFHQKKMRFVFCPHGNSDKGASQKASIPRDISLVYGQQMLEQLKNTQAHSKATIITGNYRYLFYQENKQFYDAIVEKELFSQIEKREKQILYAPTWKDGENPSSFFQACGELIETLPPTYGLIIKLHPLLEEFHPAETLTLLGKYGKRPGVLFLENFPPIYPLLEKIDIYLGDFSSIGYDMLLFDRPLYFLNSAPSKASPLLHNCGLVIPPTSYKEMYAYIERTEEKNRHEFSARRKEMVSYAFGDIVSGKELRHSLSLIF